MNVITKNLTSLKQGEGLRAQLVRSGTGTIGIKIAGIGLSLGTAVVLARSLGPENYGIYAYVYALVTLLAIPAQFGIPTLVVRETAKAEANEDWGRMRGMWRWANAGIALLVLVIAIVCGIAAWVFSDRFATLQLITFAWGLSLIPLIALGSLRGAALQGLRKVARGQLPEQIIRPVLLIGFVLVAWLTTSQVNAVTAMSLHVAAAGIAFAIGAWMLMRARPAPLRAKPPPFYDSKQWAVSTMPFAMMGALTVINSKVDIVMLGFFVPAKEIGIYNVAVKGAGLMFIGLTAVGIVLRPHLARYFAQHDTKRLQTLATAAAVAGLLSSIPLLLVYVFFGTWFLQHLFGSAFVAGYVSLLILSVGRVCMGSFGTIGRILTMGGREKDAAKGTAAAVVLNIVLNLVLIPFYGIRGAALSTALSLVIRSLILWHMGRKQLGIDSSVFTVRGLRQLKKEMISGS